MTAKCKVAKEKNDCWPGLLEEAKKKKKKKKLEKITFTADHNEGKINSLKRSGNCSLSPHEAALPEIGTVLYCGEGGQR